MDFVQSRSVKWLFVGSIALYSGLAQWTAELRADISVERSILLFTRFNPQWVALCVVPLSLVALGVAGAMTHARPLGWLIEATVAAASAVVIWQLAIMGVTVELLAAFGIGLLVERALSDRLPRASSPVPRTQPRVPQSSSRLRPSPR